MTKDAIQSAQSLALAVHDLLQGMSVCTVKTHQTRVFKTVSGLLCRIDSLVDESVTAEIGQLLKANDEQKGGVVLSIAEVLAMPLSALGLPPRLYAPIRAVGILKMQDLADLTVDQLTNIDGIGPAGADYVLNAMGKFSLTLIK